jgi:hypothetical protein
MTSADNALSNAISAVSAAVVSVNNRISAVSALATSGGGGSLTFTASISAPSSPKLGDEWYDTAADVLYLRINDGSGNLWLDVSSSGISSNSNIQNIVYSNLGTSQTQIDYTPTGTIRTVTYLTTARDNVNSNYKASRVTILHDGTNVYFTESDTVYSNSSAEVVTYNSDILTGNIRMLATGDSANVTIQMQKVTLGTDTLAGNVAGIYANLSLGSLNNVDLATVAPANGYALAYNSVTSKWQPTNIETPHPFMLMGA